MNGEQENADEILRALGFPAPTQRLKFNDESPRRRDVVVELFDYDKLLTLGESVEFHVPKYVQCGGLHQIFWPSGCGKTWLALNASMSIAMGKAFLSIEAEPGRVAYVVGEGRFGMPARIGAWLAHHDLARTANFLVTGSAVPMNDRDFVSALVETVTTRFGANPDLLVIDTMAANARAPFNDSSSEDQKVFVDGCQAAMRETGAGLVVVHHTGWDTSRERGSGALRAACDVVWKIERAGRNVARLIVDKARDYAEPDPLDVEFVPSGNGLITVRASRSFAAYATMLDVLNALHRSPASLSASDWQARSPVRRTQFYEVKAALLQANVVAKNEKARFYPTQEGVTLCAQSGGVRRTVGQWRRRESVRSRVL